MPTKDFGGGSNDFEMLQTEHGHRARARHMDEMTDEEVHCDIDERRNAVEPERTTPGYRPED